MYQPWRSLMQPDGSQVSLYIQWSQRSPCNGMQLQSFQQLEMNVDFPPAVKDGCIMGYVWLCTWLFARVESTVYEVLPFVKTMLLFHLHDQVICFCFYIHLISIYIYLFMYVAILLCSVYLPVYFSIIYLVFCMSVYYLFNYLSVYLSV